MNLNSNKMRKLLLPALLLIVSVLHSQNSTIKNYGTTIIVKQNTNLKTSNYINEPNGTINNNGNIVISQDWVNNAGNNVFIYQNNTGNTILNGQNTQKLKGETTTRFENLIINNSSVNAVEMEDVDQEISNSLSLQNGIVSTNTNTLILSNPNASALTTFSNNAFINGNLRRYISSNNDTYFFPVGNDTSANNYYLAELVNHNINGVNYIDASFEELLDFDFQNLSVSDLMTMSYDEINQAGVWELDPDNNLTSGTYDLKLHIDNIQGLSDNRFAIVSRPDASTTAADWSCDPCGIGSIGLSPDYGEGRLVSDGYAMRKGFDHFTQFGIAMASCPTPQLPADTAICFGDTVYLYPGNFDSYTWSTGSTDSAIYASQTDEYIVNVTTSIAGCETASDTVNLFVSKIETDVNVQNVTCYGYNDGLIYINAQGGIPEYHYNWLPANNDNDTISNLAPLTYSVTITDSIGCKQVINKIDITEPDSLYLTAEITENVCYGDSAAAINVRTYGGTPDYNYNWSNGETSQSINYLTDGSYSLTISDANNCTKTETFDIQSDATPIEITAEVGQGEHQYGYIYTNVSGGTPDYNYSWNYDVNNKTPNAENLYAGEYTVTVSDFYGCQQTATFVIEAQLTIPNVITPNEDGYNDYFDIVNLESFDKVTIQIFNRWGDKLFEYNGDGRTYREDKSLQWNAYYNGKKLPLGTYVYLINLDNKKEANGTITIVY